MLFDEQCRIVPLHFDEFDNVLSIHYLELEYQHVGHDYMRKKQRTRKGKIGFLRFTVSNLNKKPNSFFRSPIHSLTYQKTAMFIHI